MGRVDIPNFTSRIEVVDGLPIHFADGGTGETLVLLHGWGGEIASFGPILPILAECFRVIAIDLPGFGKSPLADRPWGTGDYADCVTGLLDQLRVEPVTLVGHSHGGRTSIAIVARRPDLVKKLVLVDSAGIVPRRGPRYYSRVYLIKAARRIFSLPGLSALKEAAMSRAYRVTGSADYNAAMNPILRSTLVRVVNEDVRSLLPTIKVPTLLIWGTNDQDTPIADGRLMERLIPDAGLVEIEGAGHFSYLDQTDRFCRILIHFVEH